MTARRLTRTRSSRRPRQADLKRAVSTAYYAVFHELCRTVADLMIGTSGSDRSLPAWRQAYRSVDHSFAKSQCRKRTVMAKFPKDIEDFGNLFVDLQDDRHRADYDPAAIFTLSDVEGAIDAAEDAIRGFRKTSVKDRRAFTAWATMKTRN